MQQEPNRPPVNQPSQGLIDDKIAAVGNEVYAFQHTKSGGSLLDRFKAMPRTQKTLFIIGACVVVSVLILLGLVLTSDGSRQANGTHVATNASDSTKSNLSEYETSDVNGDGIVDQYDIATESSASTDSAQTDGSSLSWWQKLINAGKTASSGTNNSTNYSDTYVAFENDQSMPSDEDELSDSDDFSYLDEGETGPDDDDYDDSDPVAVPVPQSPTPTTPVPAGGADITFATWNTLFSNSLSNVAKGVTAIGKKADIIGFQELHSSDRRKKMRDTLLCSSCAFSGYVQNYSTNGSNPGSVAIVWRKSRFSVVKSGYFKVSDAQHISTKTGSTGNKISKKWITWVLLTDKRTGSKLYFLNTHTVASLESKGKVISSEKARLKNYEHHMDVLTSKINGFKASGLPVFVTGDFNVNYRYDHKVQYKEFPYSRLGAIGVHSTFQRLNLAGVSKSQGSHGSGNRLIDYVWYADNPNVYPVSESISTTRYGSDHYPVFSTANVR